MELLKGMTHLSKSGRVRTFTVHVNDACQVTVWRHGDDGEPVDFVTLHTSWDLPRVLSQMLIADKGVTTINVTQDGPRACLHSLGERLWSDVAAILNGKAGVNRARMDERHRAYGCGRYVKQVCEGGKWVYVVTDLGKKLDAMHDVPKAADQTTTA